MSALPPGYERQGDLLVRSAARPRLERYGLTSLEAVFALPAERRNRFKALARLPAAEPELYVKRWDFDRREVWLRSVLKGGKFPVFSGPTELRNLLALAEAGLRVPLPLAAGELDEGGRRRSCVVLARLEGQPLEQLPPPQEPSVRRQRVRELAALVRRLHQAGFWHKDLYLCNVYWDLNAGLGLLDCERVCRDPSGVPERWRVKDLGALDASAQGWSCSDRLRFLCAYLERSGLDPGARELARAVRRKALRLERHGGKGPGSR